MVHCFCMSLGVTLLGGLLDVSRSVERKFMSVLSIYPRILLSVLYCVAFKRYLLVLCFLFS